MQVWEEFWAGAEDGQGVSVAGKKGGAGRGGRVDESQALAGRGEEELEGSMEGSGRRCQCEARRRWFRWVFVRVVIEGGDGEVNDVGEGSEGGVAEGACEGEGL